MSTFTDCIECGASFITNDSLEDTHCKWCKENSPVYSTVKQLQDRLSEAEKVISSISPIHENKCNLKVGDDMDTCTCYVSLLYDYQSKYLKQECPCE